MSQGISIKTEDAITPRLQALYDGLADDRKTVFLEKMGLLVVAGTKAYLDGLAGTRHATAEALGATTSGFFAQAAEAVNLVVNPSAATVSVDQPGMGRAAHDVDITPGPDKDALALPLIAEAYNQRAYAVDGLFVVHLVGGGEPLLAMEAPDGGLVFWYRLVPSVHQEQDRTLLPSDEEIAQWAREGALDYVSGLLEETGGALA